MTAADNRTHRRRGSPADLCRPVVHQEPISTGVPRRTSSGLWRTSGAAVDLGDDLGVFSSPPFHPHRPGLVTPARVDPDGLLGPTPGRARGPGWRRTSPGLYLPAAADLGHTDQRIVAAAGVLHPDEAVTGWASLRWRRARWFDGVDHAQRPLPVPLVVRRHLVKHPTYRLSQEFVSPLDVEELDGLALTSVRWAVCFEARWADDLTAAVIAVDMAAYSDLISLAELAPYVGSRMAPTGIAQARKAVGLAEENSWSPQETMMRLLWKEWNPRAHLLCNPPLFDRGGRHLATPDLLDPIAGVAGEYEGAVHLAGEQRARDVRREARLRDVGLEVVTMVASDQADRRAFLERLAAAHRRAGAVQGERLWTTTTPRWWTDTSTVASRRVLDPQVRSRLLRHRWIA